MLPFLQHMLHFIDSGKLYGYYTDAPDISFSWTRWFDGTYQRGKDDYLNDHTGFRPDLLRLNGQIKFSLYRAPDYGSTVLDKDNYLYYENYINAYFGEDFIGNKPILEKLLKLKALQDTFAKLNKSLILVYSPSKAFYNASSITYLNKCAIKNGTNTQAYRRIGDSLGINQVDFNAWFVFMKNTSKELLFSKQGIHWTVYGAIIAADSMIRYIENLRHIKMAHPAWTKIEHTTVPRETDNDIGRVLNLIFPVAIETYSYPELHFTDSAVTKPVAIFIGDSFTWTLITSDIMKNVFSTWEFWDYFRQVHKEDTPDQKMEDYNWVNALDNADCIILLYNSINLPELGNGFIEKAYNYYFP